MKRIDNSASTTVGRVEGDASRRRKAETTVFHCLVSSASQTRRNLISQAATSAGWETLVCASPEIALREFQRNRYHFAMVDLDDRGETPIEARELVQALTQDASQILVGVCGHEANPEEEIWVRQMGIWLYLPGVTSSSEIAVLCEQALQIVSAQETHPKIPVS